MSKTFQPTPYATITLRSEEIYDHTQHRNQRHAPCQWKTQIPKPQHRQLTYQVHAPRCGKTPIFQLEHRERSHHNCTLRTVEKCTFWTVLLFIDKMFALLRTSFFDQLHASRCTLFHGNFYKKTRVVHLPQLHAKTVEKTQFAHETEYGTLTPQ